MLDSIRCSAGLPVLSPHSPDSPCLVWQEKSVLQSAAFLADSVRSTVSPRHLKAHADFHSSFLPYCWFLIFPRDATNSPWLRNFLSDTSGGNLGSDQRSSQAGSRSESGCGRAVHAEDSRIHH